LHFASDKRVTAIPRRRQPISGRLSAVAARKNGHSRPVDGARRARRSRCPVSCTLDVLGDRWSLLVVRDLVRGKTRYAEFLESKEHIPTNILAERLKRLVAAGIVKPRRYSSRPPRVEYLLTAKGEDLRPIVRAMADWGVKHAGGQLPPDVVARRATESAPPAAGASVDQSSLDQ
jgi:DNA-binding HxlR family transcriptional regulator